MIIKTCESCGGDDVHMLTACVWDVALQEWVVDDCATVEFGDYYCRSCEDQTRIVDVERAQA